MYLTLVIYIRKGLFYVKCKAYLLCNKASMSICVASEANLKAETKAVRVSPSSSFFSYFLGP